MSAATKKVTYQGKHDEVRVPVGQIEHVCARGSSIEVPVQVAESLLRQGSNWAETTTAKKAAPATDKGE